MASSTGKRRFDGSMATANSVAHTHARVHPARIRTLHECDAASNPAGPVIYWMSRDQRIDDNWALLHAQDLTKSHVIIVFSLVRGFLGAGLRQFAFMMKGLAEVERRAAQLRIPFVVLEGEPSETVCAFAVANGASAVVCDFSPLRIGREWRNGIVAGCKRHGIAVHEVDTHNIVPVWTASGKLEYAARTIRPKIMTKLPEFLVDFPDVTPQAARPAVVTHVPLLGASTAAAPVVPVHVGRTSAGSSPELASASAGAATPELAPYTSGINWSALLDSLPLDRTVTEVAWAVPGFTAGMDALKRFLTTGLKLYDEKRNDPTVDAQSNLSPWLHFGQIAPARAAHAAMQVRKTAPKAVDAFIEELVVRRELTDNYCWYNQRYDELDGLYPQYNNESWAQRTLREHADDKREFVYTFEQFERGETHEALWNACQLEMVHRGKMHGFCRMYWAKKILEWSASPEEALRIAIALNDKYQLDGRDPNGYVGCAWAIAGLHDQGWAERKVFGKIRYMNLAGESQKMLPAYLY